MTLPRLTKDAGAVSAPARSLRLRSLAVWAVVALLGLLLIHGSAPFGMADQGDFARTVSRVVGEPLSTAPGAGPDGPVTRWRLPEGLPVPNPSSGSSSFLFAAAAWLQSGYQDRFDLLHLGLAGKTLLLAGLWLLAVAAGRRGGFGAVGQGALAAGLMLAAFAAHNIGFLQSFYGEYSFVLGLPVLLAALLWPEGRMRKLLLLAGLVLCAGAKAQFFYLPLLVLAVLWLQARAAGRRLGASSVAGLLLVQGLCLLPLAASDVVGLNRHHSVRLGSHLAMTEAERDRLGLAPAERACIGVDAWGNRLETLDAVRLVRGEAQCPVIDRTLLDVLRPYAVAPRAALRLVTVGLPPHLTVRYFHLQANYLYAVPLTHRSGPVTDALRGLTDMREGLLRPWALPLVLVAAFWVALRGLRREPADGLAAPLLLLALVCVSQVPVVLLGEGVRDLSKHLAGAQYALDLMLVLLAGHVGAALVRRRPQGVPGPSS
jgi:hypothetical protein